MAVYDYNRESSRKRIKGKLAVALAAGAGLVVLAIVVSIYLEIIQLEEIGGFSHIYVKNLTYMVISFFAAFLVIFCAAALTNSFITKNLGKYCEDKGFPQKKLPGFSFAAIIALLGAFITRNMFYLNALTFINSTAFGKTDPVFGRDIGYYMFQRPFLMSLYDFVSGLWIFMIIYTIGYYLVVLVTLHGNLTLKELKIKSVLRHNLINIALLFIIKALSYRFKMEGILYSEVAGLKGAGYVEVNVWLNYYRAAPFLLLALVAAALYFLSRDKIKKAALAIAVFPAAWTLVLIASLVVQGVVVAPNEFSLESEYIGYNIEKTREAFALDRIMSYEFPKVSGLTPEIISRNKETKENIRVIDYNSTLLTNIQLQTNRLFYTFSDGDIINYSINGKETPVLISAREIDKSRLDKTYINMTYKYTHGYGVVINPINRLTSNGQADYILRDLAHTSLDPALKVSEPRIYYGEQTRDHVIVNAANGLEEIDYDGSTTTRYAGNSGVRLTFLNRLIFAAKYGDLNMITSGYAANAKLLLNRQVAERAQRAVPFLTVDTDPYIILTEDGRLKWVLDAYTVSNAYPYAQSYGNINYIRNSVKIVMDAYDGKAEYYLIDKDDPIAVTYGKMYPGLFTGEVLPEAVSRHMKYPERLFKIQTELLRAYHLDEKAVSMFYEQQDRWDIAKYATEKNTTTPADIEPYYNMIKLPGEIGTKAELILMRPFTPSGGQKHNMVSWLAVRNSSENYGEMILFHFPKNTNIFGPNQIEVKINQIDEISSDMTLWGQSGSDVYKGNLLVIPIEDSILYVEPIYIKAAGESSSPEVKKIVVGYQREDEFIYGIGTNLENALSNLFKTEAVPQAPPPSLPETDGTADRQLLGDLLEKYGELIKQVEELGELIEKIKERGW